MATAMLALLLVAGWIQVESPRFLLRTDASEQRAKAYIEQLEKNVVDPNDVPALTLLKAPTQTRVVVTVFNDENDFKKHFEAFTVRSLLFEEGPAHVYTSAAKWSVPAIARAHMVQVLRDVTEEAPIWLTLGLGAYAAAAKREGEEWVIGTRPQFAEITGEAPDLTALLAMRDDFATQDYARIELCGWTLVQMLLNGSDELPLDTNKLAQWFADIRNGEPPGEALQKAYPGLENAYEKRFAATKLTVIKSQAKPVAKPASAKKIPAEARIPVPSEALLKNDVTRMAGHVRLASGTSDEAQRRLQLEKALATAPGHPALLAMALKHELVSGTGCGNAMPLATKLLTAPAPRLKKLARDTVLVCKQVPPQIPPVTFRVRAETPPDLAVGEKMPAIPADTLMKLKGKTGSVYVRMRVGKNGLVENAAVVRSNLPEMDPLLVDLVKTWRFAAKGHGFDWVQPFAFNFGVKK